MKKLRPYETACNHTNNGKCNRICLISLCYGPYALELGGVPVQVITGFVLRTQRSAVQGFWHLIRDVYFFSTEVGSPLFHLQFCFITLPYTYIHTHIHTYIHTYIHSRKIHLVFHSHLNTTRPSDRLPPSVPITLTYLFFAGFSQRPFFDNTCGICPMGANWLISPGRPKSRP
jgi:hypothetical protein